MLAGWGVFSAFSFPVANCLKSPHSQDIRYTRAGVNVAAIGLVSVLALGCLPGDGSEANQSEIEGPVSNVAAKSDRLSFGSVPGRDTAGGNYRVETTAAVVPTSASDPGATAPARPAEGVPAQEALEHFFKALTALEHGTRKDPVTILHLGDDHIAADRLASVLRSDFQARFGDAGRGFMAPGTFRVAEARIARQGDWRAASSAAGDDGPFGLTGVRLTGRNGARLNLTMRDAPFDWAEITFAAGPNTGTAFVAVDKQGDSVSTRTAKSTWQRIKINAGGKDLTVRAEGDRPIHLLSWMVVRDTAGIHYVNLGVPGATARTPKRWKDAFVEADLERLSPDLIILGYGTNEAFDHTFDRKAYAGAVHRLIDRLKSAAPQASLLVMGPPDVARIPAYASLENADACRALTAEERTNYTALLRAQNPRLGRWHPPVNLRNVRRTLRRAASEHGAFFWDWFEFMGGACSIHAWVHARPPLATADHRHFTERGARESARALFQDVMRAYQSYRARTARAAQ